MLGLVQLDRNQSFSVACAVNSAIFAFVDVQDAAGIIWHKGDEILEFSPSVIMPLGQIRFEVKNRGFAEVLK